MTATGHAVVGTVIAATGIDPVIGIPLAIFSHIVCDLFPHWDSGTNGKNKSHFRYALEGIADVLVGFIVSYAIIILFFPQTNLLYAFILIIAAQFFDYVTIPYIVLDWHFPPFSWFHWLQSRWNIRLDKPWGIINQIAVLLLLIAVVKLY